MFQWVFVVNLLPIQQYYRSNVFQAAKMTQNSVLDELKIKIKADYPMP